MHGSYCSVSVRWPPHAQIGGRLPKYRFTTGNTVMIAAWLVVIGKTAKSRHRRNAVAAFDTRDEAVRAGIFSTARVTSTMN